MASVERLNHDKPSASETLSTPLPHCCAGTNDSNKRTVVGAVGESKDVAQQWGTCPAYKRSRVQFLAWGGVRLISGTVF